MFQAGVFVCVAKALEVSSYGLYVGLLALATMVGSFTGLGSRVLIMRDTLKGKENLRKGWSKTLCLLFVTSPVLLAIFFLVSSLVLPGGIPFGTVLGIGIAEVSLLPITYMGINICQAAFREFSASNIMVMSTFPKLLAALFILLLSKLYDHGISLLGIWGILYLVASFISAIYTVWVVTKKVGKPVWIPFGELFTTLKKGIPFSLNVFGEKAIIDLDKAMITRLASPQVAGIYSVAYRLTDFAMIPLQGFMAAATPRIFSQGKINQEVNVIPKIVFWGILGGIIVGVGIYFVAPIIPRVLGLKYEASINIVRWMAWLPIVFIIRNLGQVLLLKLDYESRVTGVLLFGASMNFLLNLVLISVMAWRGAILATFVTETVLIFMIVFLLRSNLRIGKCEQIISQFTKGTTKPKSEVQ